MAEKFNLKWNDFHSNVSKSFGLFRNESYLHDVTLVTDDFKQIQAHKLVLSACSRAVRVNRKRISWTCFKEISQSSPQQNSISCCFINRTSNLLQNGKLPINFLDSFDSVLYSSKQNIIQPSENILFFIQKKIGENIFTETEPDCQPSMQPTTLSFSF